MADSTPEASRGRVLVIDDDRAVAAMRQPGTDFIHKPVARHHARRCAGGRPYETHTASLFDY
jgi:hypothetical protein